MRGAHGDRAGKPFSPCVEHFVFGSHLSPAISDFKGEDGGIYVILSTRDISLAVGVKHATFLSPFSKLWVHGSWIRHVYWTVSTSMGRLLCVHLDAHNPMFNGSAAPTTSVVDDVRFIFNDYTLSVITSTWRTKAQVTKGRPHFGHLRINIEVQPLYDVVLDSVAPHGLLGQTYDTDNQPIHGKRDRYDIMDDGRPTWTRSIPGGRVTTKAKAEGAIEGVAEMYRIKTPFDTNFTFSRFRASHATPRNASILRSSLAHQIL